MPSARAPGRPATSALRMSTSSDAGPVSQAPLAKCAAGQGSGVRVDLHADAGGVRSRLEHRRQVQAGTAPDVEHPARPTRR